jgi:cytochrome c-type biogenesis protein CcmF
MTAELGVFLLAAACMTCLFQAAALLPFTHMQSHIRRCLFPAAWLQSLCVTLAFALLIVLRLANDFSVANVAAHSNVHLPTLYKIVGAWGNHEGSMLLFIWVLAAYGLALAAQSPLSRLRGRVREGAENGWERELIFRTIAIQSLLCASFLVFILFTSNPFTRLFPPAADGEALNPLLQDIALAMHPPLLYVGYVGFSLVFSLAVAALLVPSQAPMQRWAQFAHPWILAAWSALTLGIGLGSWWAYRELGWGGWWAWDPVENASLLPWLSGTALLHANIVLKKRGLLGQWVILLAIVTFGLSLLGTFLVRSGALTSVHSFATDPMRGMLILGYMAAMIGGALLLFALRGGRRASVEKVLPLSREGMVVINNMFVLSACATVLLGTIYPLLIEWANGSKLTVGPAFFNATFLPLMALPLLFAGLAPLMPWKNASMRQALFKAQSALLAACAAMLLVLAVAKTKLVFAAMGFGLAAWLAASSLQWLLGARGKGRAAVFAGHLGVAILVAGITGAGLWKVEVEKSLAVGEKIDVARFTVLYEKTMQEHSPNYDARIGYFSLHDAQGKKIATLMPEFRRYNIGGTSTSEAALYSTVFYDVYGVIGDASVDGIYTSARFYYIPLIGFIWLGCAMIGTSGVIAILSARRKRHA